MRHRRFPMIKWSFWPRNILAMTGAVFVFLMPVSAAFAEDTVTLPHMDSTRILSAVQKEVTIQEKTPVDILADLQRYAVTPDTVIDMGGGTLTFSEMPVPCRAYVYYEIRKNQDPEAVKIEILDFGPGAGTQWNTGMPE